jgi:hypothetical protein
MTTIVRTEITFTVLHRSDEPIDSLAEAVERADTGHAVGLDTSWATTDVPDPDVPAALKELGNDGEFFEGDLNPDSDEVRYA